MFSWFMFGSSSSSSSSRSTWCAAVQHAWLKKWQQPQKPQHMQDKEPRNLMRVQCSNGNT